MSGCCIYRPQRSQSGMSVRRTRPADLRYGLRRYFYSVGPEEKFGEACDFVVCGFAEDSGEPGWWIDFIELGYCNKPEGDCHGFNAALGAFKHQVVSANGDRFYGVLGCVVVSLWAAMLKVWPPFLASGQEYVGWPATVRTFQSFSSAALLTILPDRRRFGWIEPAATQHGRWVVCLTSLSPLDKVTQSSGSLFRR